MLGLKTAQRIVTSFSAAVHNQADRRAFVRENQDFQRVRVTIMDLREDPAALEIYISRITADSHQFAFFRTEDCKNWRGEMISQIHESAGPYSAVQFILACANYDHSYDASRNLLKRAADA